MPWAEPVASPSWKVLMGGSWGEGVILFTFLPPLLASSSNLAHRAWVLQGQRLHHQKSWQMLEGAPWFRLCFSPGQRCQPSTLPDLNPTLEFSAC